MKKLLLVLTFLTCFTTAYAQTQSGSITTNASTCTPGVCVQLTTANNWNAITIDVSGTWTGTLSFEFSADSGTTYRALSTMNVVSQSSVTSTTANGTFTTVNNNYTNIRVRGSASITGTANVLIRPSSNNSTTGIIFGGGGSTIGTVNQGTASGSENWRVNCVTGCSGGTSDTDDASIAAGQSTSIPASLTQVFDGSVWRRLTIGTAGTASSQVVTVQGIASMTPFSVTFPSAQSVTVSSALPAGTNNIGDVDVLSMPADATELPAAAAAADNMANPTAPFVLAASMCWDGTTWDRCTGSSSDTELPTAAAAADNMSNPTAPFVLAANMCWDGSTWDRCVDSAIPAGTNNIGDVDVASIAAGDNNIGNVDIVTLPALAAGTNNIGDVDVLTLPALPTGTNSIGQVTGGNSLPIIACNNVAVIDTAASGNTQLVAISASTTIYICSYSLTAEATVDVRLVRGTGTACATGETSISGTYAFSTTTGVLGLTRGSGLGMITKGNAGDAVCIETSGAVQINGEITYAQY